MTNIVSTPRQNAYKTNLSTSIDAAALVASFDEMPSFSLSAGEHVYAVLDPKNGFREVHKLVGPYTAGDPTITITRAEPDYEGASSTAQPHSAGAVVVITNSWNIFDDITTAVNSKLDADGDGLEDSFDMTTASSGVRMRDDSGELKLTDNLNPEVSLSTLAAAAGADTKTGVTVADTTPAVLDSKLTVSGNSIVKSVVNPGANETLNLDVTVDTTPVDTDYTAEEDIAAGGLVSKTSVADEVENTIVSALGTAGGESEFTPNAIVNINSTYVSDHKVAAVYSDSDTSESRLVIGTVEIGGKTVTWGTPVTLDATGTNITAVERMEDDKIVILHEFGGNLIANVATISGTVPTVGADSTVAAAPGTAGGADVAVIDTDKIVVAYLDSADASKGKARCATVSGTTIGTFGTAEEFEAGATDFISIAKYDTDKAGVFYQDDDDSDKGKGALLVATGTSLAANVPVEFEANAITYTTCSQLDTDKIIIAYYDTIGGPLDARVASLSGLTISYGVEAQVDASALATPSVDTISATEAYISYETTSSSDGKFNKLSISGTTITVGDQYTINGGTNNVAYTSLAKVSDKSKFIICYRDEADSNKGKAEVFQEWDNSDAIVGFNTATVTATNTAVVRSKGVIDNQAGLTAGTKYYLSATGAITSTAHEISLGVAKDIDEIDIGIGKTLDRTLVDGSNAESLHTHTIVKVGTSTRAAATASGDEVIPHGLGIAPKAITFFATASDNDASNYHISSGVFSDALQSCIYSATTSSNSGEFAGVIRVGTNANNQAATVAVDDTNITLTWTKTGSGWITTFNYLAIA